MSPRSVYLRGQADACRADTQVELRRLADKFIVRAVENRKQGRD
jgi:hypothetical protein